MNKQDKIEFAKIIMVLSEMFVGKEKPSKELIKIYFQALIEYDIQQIQQACDFIVKSWGFHFMPKPADFIKHIEGSKEEQALIAWQNLLNEINLKGMAKAELDEPTRRAINACGGIDVIGLCDRNKLTFIFKDFVNNYKVIAKTEYKAIENKKLNELTKGIG